MVPEDPIDILLVEDNPADAHLTDEGLSQGDVPYELTVVEDGQAALAYLRQEGEYRDATRPDLVLLDLNLPRLSGYDVLKRVKRDEALREIPIVILSTSDDPDDIQTCYDNCASGFVTKPTEYRSFVSRVQQIGVYWSRVAHTPDHRAPSGA